MTTFSASSRADALAALLRRTQPVTLIKQGAFHAFRRRGLPRSPPLRGLTKWLAAHLFAPESRLPSASSKARGGTSRVGLPPTPASWRGVQGGQRRGSAIDRQVTRLINRQSPRSTGARSGDAHPFARMVGQALSLHGLRPLVAQRGVGSDGGVATAADIVAVDSEGRLVVVEVKCGFVGIRDAPVVLSGRSRKSTRQNEATAARPRFRPPLGTTLDCARNRHLAQLAATRSMLASEKSMLAQAVEESGLSTHPIRGVLLYVDATGVETVELSATWAKRGDRLVACFG